MPDRLNVSVYGNSLLTTLNARRSLTTDLTISINTGRETFRGIDISPRQSETDEVEVELSLDERDKARLRSLDKDAFRLPITFKHSGHE
ncbi:hypothetical protein H0H87_004046 [Tephrocybe sp. NHM501043]|nr:hypothetical protein H0H87_004046 [Tephrocybe sp. NHM501043]